MEDIVQESVRLLAVWSQYTSVVVAPNLSRGTIRCLQLIPLDEFNVLLVLVVDPGFPRAGLWKHPGL